MGRVLQRVGVTLLFLVAAWRGPAATVYTNEPDFLARIGGTPQFLNNFDDLEGGLQYNHPINYSSNGFQYTITSQPPLEIWSLPGAVSVVEHTDEIVVALGTTNVGALGGWFYLTSAFGAQTNGTLRVILSDGSTNYLALSTNLSPAFTGFATTGAPFTSVRLRSQTTNAFATLDHFYVAEGIPTLAIRQTAAGVMVSWPSPATGYVLQSAPSLAAGGWADAGGTLQSTNGQWQVEFPATQEATFYRLLHR
jgi:hypothetical protein